MSISMPTTKTVRAAGLALAGLLATVTPARADDLARMQGAWITEAYGGAPITFTFKGPKLEIRGDSSSYVLSASIDEKARPEKAIDLKAESSSVPGAEGRASAGIYRFEGESLIVCLGLQGRRPSTFDTRVFDQLRFDLWRAPSGSAEAIAKKAVEPAAADSDAPLPDGWPKATKPGSIEVKAYPKYRSAIVREQAATVARGEGMFFALFGHITGKGVEMTAPVVMTYEPRIIEHPDEKGAASMEFLYQHPDQGKAGPGIGKVKVEDHPSVTVVSLGVQGDIRPEQMRASVGRLRAWLAEHKDEWVAAGPPRRLGYHGPQTPPDRRLNEVQIPIRPAH